jgi:uncharacterized protein (DUF488 family)
MAPRFYTVGHSTRTIAEFADLVRAAGVELIADVRTIPRSRTNPQFNRETLPDSLGGHQIGYEHIAALGGLRGKQRSGAPSPNTLWQNDSFRNYADYALTDRFRDGLARLRELGTTRTVAIMCAEAVWWRCHRRIIADYLLVEGAAVLHLMDAGKVQPAALTPGARATARGIVYDRPAGQGVER